MPFSITWITFQVLNSHVWLMASDFHGMYVENIRKNVCSDSMA